MQAVYFPPIRRSFWKNLFYWIIFGVWLVLAAGIWIQPEQAGKESIELLHYLKLWKNGFALEKLLRIVGREAVPFFLLGMLLPLVHAGRCQNGTLLTAGLIASFFELLQYGMHRGVMACDTIWLCVLAAFLGYRCFLMLCRLAPQGFCYLRTYDNPRKCTWLLFLLLLSGVFYFGYTPSGQTALSDRAEDAQKLARSVLDGTFFSELADGPKAMEADIYQKLYKDLSDGRKTVSISLPMNAEEDVLTDQYSKVVWEHPELFWLSGGARIHGTGTAGRYYYTITSEFAEGVQDLDSMKAAFDQTVDSLVSQAQQFATDGEKVRFIHDYLISNSEYDLETYYRPDCIFAISHTAYGCLVKHQAVCAGYAKAFQLLMDRLEIPCGTVRGTAVNALGSGGHAWNFVCIDGVYSYVDVTWDDPVSLTGKGGTVSHEYFCVSAEKMAENHIPDADQEIPEALRMKQ